MSGADGALARRSFFDMLWGNGISCCSRAETATVLDLDVFVESIVQDCQRVANRRTTSFSTPSLKEWNISVRRDYLLEKYLRFSSVPSVFLWLTILDYSVSVSRFLFSVQSQHSSKS